MTMARRLASALPVVALPVDNGKSSQYAAARPQNAIFGPIRTVQLQDPVNTRFDVLRQSVRPRRRSGGRRGAAKVFQRRGDAVQRPETKKGPTTRRRRALGFGLTWTESQVWRVWRGAYGAFRLVRFDCRNRPARHVCVTRQRLARLTRLTWQCFRCAGCTVYFYLSTLSYSLLLKKVY